MHRENGLQRSGTVRRPCFSRSFGGNVSLWKWALRSHICSRYFPVSQTTFCCLKDVGLSASSPVPCLPILHYVPP
ncbi:hypothetical protein LEMLEM_LOCUS11597 [Lemmus lemmus]